MSSTMSSYKEKERFKEQQEQFQAVLSVLLKDEDNKYCVDCDAKGPRWASWNLGIFLCIRCAGIHRNLGVHISKVKSVNLDTWTPEQVAMMQEMGNSRGRAVYEANIPDGFRRPQTDSALEAFIRSKYEQKKYIAREWIPPQPRVPKEWLDDAKGDKKKAKAKPVAGMVQLTNVNKLSNKPGETTPPGDFNKPSQGPKPEAKAAARSEAVPHSASNDLLGLDLGTPQTNAHQAAAPPISYGNNELLDLFGGPQISQTTSNTVPAQSNSDLMNGASEGGLFGEDKAGTGGGAAKTSAKDSIMALYGGGGGGGGSTNQPQMYGVPASHSDLTITNSSAKTSQSQSMMQPSNQPVAVFSTSTTHQPQFNNITAPVSHMGKQPPSYGQISSGYDVLHHQNVYNPNAQPGQYLPFSQSSFQGFQQQMASVSNSGQAPSLSAQFLSPTKQSPGFTNRAPTMMETQDFSQSLGSNAAWGTYNLAQPTFYGNQGGVYMPQGQQMYPGNMPQQQGMMGIQGIRQPHGMMGQPHGMMGQPQGMGMMGQPHGMMGNPGMNTPQMAMYNTPMMAANPGMYTPQQMQQLQFQQMQQQMTSLKLSGTQMSSVPQQTTGAAAWGPPGQGQTLSTNLWQ